MATALDVTQILLNCSDANVGVRTAAEQQLVAAQEANYAGFLATLAAELANAAKPAMARQLAGLVMKNALDAKDDVRKAELQARWGAVDPSLKATIRDSLLATLPAESPEVRHTAALVVAKVAAIDLPKHEWPGLIQALLANMSHLPPNPGMRQATLEALGYVCEEMGLFKEDVLSAEQVNLILTAVVGGMRPEEPDMLTRLAATQALTNAIEFAEHNFDNEQERNYIMQVVCAATAAGEPRIRVAAFTCLHEIAANYYPKLPAYMTEVYNITVRAVREDEEDVALQAIEFWSTLCDYELDLQEEGGEGSEVNHHFIRAVTPHLTPVLLEQLTKQEEGQDVDESAWNIAMAAGTCLGLMARVAGDDLVPLIMPFVTANISKNTSPEDWHAREAATFAFGSVLEGPSPSALLGIVKEAMGFLLQAMKDPVAYVRDTTAWTIGRIFEFLHDAQVELITKDNLPAVMQVLVDSLSDEAHIAIRVCDAIGRLAEGFTNSPGPSSPLSPFFKEVVSKLLATAQRHAGGQAGPKMQVSAFEAICDLVRAASQDTLDTVAALIPVFVRELGNTLAAVPTSSEAREKQGELQGQLCGVLQVIIQKLSEADSTKAMVLQYGDGIMEVLLLVMAGRADTVHEEALLAVGAFTYACGRQFGKYMPAFFPHLVRGLRNHQEWQVCVSAVGVLGDVCRNMEDDVAPYCDDVMTIMVSNLGSQEVHRSIKPHILSAFGDIALVLGDRFEKYLDTVKRMLQQAMHLSIQQAQQSSDEDFLDYNNDLRVGILEAYSGLFQGLGPGKAEVLLSDDVLPILALVSSIGAEAGSGVDDTVARNAVNLMGDICTVIPSVGSALQQARGQDWEKLVHYCQESETLAPDTDWAINAIQTAIASA